MRLLLAAAAVLIAAVFGLPGTATAQDAPQTGASASSATGDADAAGTALQVRVVARLGADGRVELGLQTLGAAAEWGERQLAENRFLPERAGVGIWLASSPLRVRIAGSGADGSPRATGPVVRITARRLADGRAEFGLQVRRDDRSWGERLLPGVRFAPPGSSHGFWLASSPLSLGADAPATERIAASQEATAAEALAALVLESANRARAAQDGLVPLQVHAELSEAAGARAVGMAESAEWLEGYDYRPTLGGGWDNWVTARSAYTSASPGDPGAVEQLAESLLTGDALEVLVCNLCTHLGVGLAARGGRTYATVVLAGGPPAERRIAAVEAAMARLVNDLRAAQGLGTLRYHDGLADVARDWSAEMGATGAFGHNPHNGAQVPPGWRVLAENISYLWPPTSLSRSTRLAFENLTNSPEHYENMVNPNLTHIGVGIVVDNAALWVTQLFARYP